jgi:hypothetical protein
MQDPDNAEDLQYALQYRDNTEAAFDQLAASLGMNILKHAAALSRGASTAGITPEALEGIAQLLNGKGHLEDAQAQISRMRGYPEAAEFHEAQRNHYWRMRDKIRACRQSLFTQARRRSVLVSSN